MTEQNQIKAKFLEALAQIKKSQETIEEKFIACNEKCEFFREKKHGGYQCGFLEVTVNGQALDVCYNQTCYFNESQSKTN